MERRRDNARPTNFRPRRQLRRLDALAADLPPTNLRVHHCQEQPGRSCAICEAHLQGRQLERPSKVVARLSFDAAGKPDRATCNRHAPGGRNHPAIVVTSLKGTAQASLRGRILQARNRWKK